MSSGQGSQAQLSIRSIQRNLSQLEELIRGFESQTPVMRSQDPRSELLEQVHVAGAIDQRRLFELLDQRGMNHTWIGAQVGSEYLEMWHGADARSWYRVTDRAVRELSLGQLASPADLPSRRQSAFGKEWAEDWSSEEDSVYDRL